MPICTPLWTNSGAWYTKPPGTRRRGWPPRHHQGARKRTGRFTLRAISASSTPTLMETCCTTGMVIRFKFPSTLLKCKCSGEWFTGCRRLPRSVPVNDHPERPAERTAAATLYRERDQFQVRGQIPSRTKSLVNRTPDRVFTEDGRKGGEGFFHFPGLLDLRMYRLPPRHIQMLPCTTDILGIVLVRKAEV